MNDKKSDDQPFDKVDEAFEKHLTLHYLCHTAFSMI